MSMDARSVKLLWKLAGLKCALYSGATLWTCWSTATSSVDMTRLGWFDWFQVIGGCLAAWCLTMSAFIDRTAGQIASGKLPGLENGAAIPDDESKVITTTTTETAVTKPTT